MNLPCPTTPCSGPIEEGFTTASDGERIRYLDSGGPGAALLLVPGLGASAAWWWRQLDGLRDAFRVVAVELRGHGASHTAGGLRVARCALDVHDVITGLGLRETTLVGWSTGATVALAYCDLLGTGSLRALAHVDMTPFAWRGEGGRGGGWARGVSSLAEQGAFLEAWRTDFSTASRGFTEGMFLPTSRPGEFDWLLREVGRVCPESLAAIAWDGFFLDQRTLLRRLDLPVLVMSGAHSPICPPGLTGWMADQIPRGRGCVLRGSRHAPFLERSGEFNRRLRELSAA